MTTITVDTPAGALPPAVDLTDPWKIRITYPRSANGAAPPPTAPTPMVIGLTAQLEEYGQHAQTFPDARFARIFSKPGAGILPFTSPAYAKLPTRTLASPPAWAPHGSFKDWPGDAAAARMVAAHLDGMPPHLRPDAPPLLPELGDVSYLLTYQHEPEGNLEPDGAALRPGDYRRRYGVLYDVVRSHKFGSRVAVCPIQTYQWTVAKSNEAKGVIKGDGDPLPWWAGVGDFVGVDAYSGAWLKSHVDPATLANTLARFSTVAGRRLIVPELGSAVVPGRAAWITAVMAELRRVGCAAVAWWCATTAGGGGEIRDFHLSDEASAQAWQAEIDRSAGRR